MRAIFGAPKISNEERRYKLEYHFYPSLSLLNGEHEGYMGFAVRFEHDRLVSWSPIRGTPSYEPPQVPPELKWIGKFYLGIALLSILLCGLGKRAWAHTRGISVVQAFNTREIATCELPAEFRFITRETTLQEVISRVGEPTSLQPMSVDLQQIKTSDLVVGVDGGPAIVVAEYELPDGSAVLLVPEYPFELDCRIRTAVCRKGYPEAD